MKRLQTRLCTLLSLSLLILIIASNSFAAHPLISDDTGTQGKKKFQLELNGEYGHDKQDGVIQRTTPAASVITVGLTDTLDLAIGVPYYYIRTHDGETTTTVRGFGDAAVSLKWRFYESEAFSVAVKPTVTFPTADDDRELGTGKIAYSIFFIGTKEIKPWTLHLNVGYIQNENRLDQRTALWHLSAAGEYQVSKDLRAVANMGIQRNSEKDAGTDPAFILGGLIYSLTEHIDLDVGYKHALTRPEVDYTFLAGVTFRF